MIDRSKPLTEQTASDLRALIDALRGNRERYDLAGRIVEVRSCDLEIAEATRALAIINRRATEAEDQREANCLTQRLRDALAEALAQCAHHNAEYKHVTPDDRIEAWRTLVVEVVEVEGESAPADQPPAVDPALTADEVRAVVREAVMETQGEWRYHGHPVESAANAIAARAAEKLAGRAVASGAIARAVDAAGFGCRPCACSGAM